MAIKAKHISRQIKAALDGRTQRWLAQQIPLADDKLSNKLKGISEFTDEEIKKISEILNIELNPYKV